MRAIVLAICVLATADAARAQAPTPNQAKADQLFAEGRAELAKKPPEAARACALFDQAIAFDPTAPGVMLNLGLCNRLLGKYATSLFWFRRAQTAASEAKPERLVAYEAAAIENTNQLVGLVAVVKIDVSRAPRDVTITVDGRTLPSRDYLRVEIDNDTVIEARAAGKEVFRQRVEITDRTAKDIVVVMEAERLPPLRDPGKPRRRLAYIVGASGLAVWGITLTYGLIVRARYEDTDDQHYDGKTGFDDAEFALRWYGTGMFAVGTLAVGTAIALYVTAPKPYRERAQLAPILTRDQLGIGYAGSF